MKYRQDLQTTEQMAAWYDKKYQEMLGTWATPPEDCNKHLDILMGNRKGGALLDIGCGGGHFMEQAMKRCNYVDGIEISSEALEYAKRRLPKVRGTYFLHQVSIETVTPVYADGYDYITALGSLEHIIDIDKALDNIRNLLKPDGIWYFYVPNELWLHEDQPNERTATDEEWQATFTLHGLETEFRERWEDNTVFRGIKGAEEHET